MGEMRTAPRGGTPASSAPARAGRPTRADKSSATTLVLASALLLASAAATASTASTEVPASIVGRAYQPAELTLEAGQTVTWTNHALTPHTVTAPGGEFDSGHITPGESFKVTFTTPGSFPYACTIHPSMHGEVTVLAPGSLPGSLKLTLAKAHTAHGQPTLLRVQAPRPGATVLLQLRAGGKWSTLRRAHLSAQGTATLRFPARAHGKLRVLVPGSGGAPPLSKTLTPKR